MNSRIMILLAVLLIAGAAIAGYLGYKTTQDAKVVTAEAEKQIVAARKAADAGIAGKVPVVVARQNIALYKVLTAEDLSIDYLKVAPPRTYSRIEDVLGQPVQEELSMGELLEKSQLQPGSNIARLLHPGERAVAIPIDEVVGGGGFVQPGDIVDILLFLRGEAGGRDSAQIVMQSLRVIGFGSEIISVNGGIETPEQKNLRNADRARARTAVLAVSENDVTRLMLASSLGTLRMAIRPPAELLALAATDTSSAVNAANVSTSTGKQSTTILATMGATQAAIASSKSGTPKAMPSSVPSAAKAMAPVTPKAAPKTSANAPLSAADAHFTSVPAQSHLLTSSVLQPSAGVGVARPASTAPGQASKAVRRAKVTPAVPAQPAVVIFRGLNSQVAP